MQQRDLSTSLETIPMQLDFAGETVDALWAKEFTQTNRYGLTLGECLEEASKNSLGESECYWITLKTENPKAIEVFEEWIQEAQYEDWSLQKWKRQLTGKIGDARYEFNECYPTRYSVQGLLEKQRHIEVFSWSLLSRTSEI